MQHSNLIEILKSFKAGPKGLEDDFFKDFPPCRLGIYDVDDEELCHAYLLSECPIPGCGVVSKDLLSSELHYTSMHMYTCCQCRKSLPSPHLLDLHVQEQHDSFFAVMAVKKPSFACYIEECKEKFLTAEERFNHGVKVHKLPKNFRFDSSTKSNTKPKQKPSNKMEVDHERSPVKKFAFYNNKQQTFKKFSVPTFTKDVNVKAQASTSTVNMDVAMADLKDSLP